MLDAHSPRSAHAAQSIGLIVLSLIFLPVDAFCLFVFYSLGSLANSRLNRHRNGLRVRDDFKPRTVLVTGVGMTKGLTLARLFYSAGHHVIGADFDHTACGSVSRSLVDFHTLKAPNQLQGSNPYIKDLLEIILKKKVELWVSCSGVASAVEDGEAMEVVEARTTCKAIQFDVKTTQMLHEKDSFIERTRVLGLNVPETHTITSRNAAEAILQRAPAGRLFILKPIGMDDSTRGDMTLLPRATIQQTSQHLDKLQFSPSAPYILQQYIKGEEYCTHSLVVRGQVKAFVACPSAELLMHYIALPATSALSRAMLQFAETFAAEHGESFTGHLSFDFLVEDNTPSRPEDIVLYPIECNPRAHTAVVLFEGTPSMTEGYLSVLSDHDLKKSSASVVVPHRPKNYYWIGHDIFASLSSLFTVTPSRQTLRTLIELVTHIFSWHDGTLEWWDPLPWFWLYHVYWPLRFLRTLLAGQRWSRVNVSTTKMFAC